MREKSEDKTSHLRPGNIDSKGVEYLKKLAKKKQKELSCKRSEALELVAKEHGFKNWNNVCRFVSKRPNSSSKFNIEGIWRKPMFVEIRSSESMFESEYALPNTSITRVSNSIRLNLALVKEVAFSSSYLNYAIREGWHFSETKPTSPLPDIFDDEDEFSPDELQSFYGKQCRKIHFIYPGELWDNPDHRTYIFFDEGDYHRVKRSIDDLTGGKSK